MTAGSLHAGLVLADNQLEVEAVRHLQSRLRILYGLMAVPAVAFYVIDQVLPVVSGTWTLDEPMNDQSMPIRIDLRNSTVMTFEV